MLDPTYPLGDVSCNTRTERQRSCLDYFRDGPVLGACPRLDTRKLFLLGGLCAFSTGRDPLETGPGPGRKREDPSAKNVEEMPTKPVSPERVCGIKDQNTRGPRFKIMC